MTPQYLVVRKQDGEPIEVYPYDDFLEASTFYEALSENWTECYLCQILKPEQRP